MTRLPTRHISVPSYTRTPNSSRFQPSSANRDITQCPTRAPTRHESGLELRWKMTRMNPNVIKRSEPSMTCWTSHYQNHHGRMSLSNPPKLGFVHTYIISRRTVVCRNPTALITGGFLSTPHLHGPDHEKCLSHRCVSGQQHVRQCRYGHIDMFVC